MPSHRASRTISHYLGFGAMASMMRSIAESFLTGREQQSAFSSVEILDRLLSQDTVCELHPSTLYNPHAQTMALTANSRRGSAKSVSHFNLLY